MSGPTVRIASTFVHRWFSAAFVVTLTTLVLCTVVFMIVEWKQGRDWRRYFSWPVMTDLAYAVFYIGGFFALLWYPISRLFEFVVEGLGFHGLALFAPLPAFVQIVLFMVVADFCEYWKHRWMHTSAFLWRFHSIHHSQTTMTLLTSYRFHFVDELFNNLIRFGIGLAIGVPPQSWLWLTALMTIYQSIQHSDTGWSFGPLDRILVSSRFHNVHHSTQPEHFLRNFGLLFSAWDFLFGTALSAARPPRYGLDEPVVPASFLGQLFFPFRGRRRRESRTVLGVSEHE